MPRMRRSGSQTRRVRDQIDDLDTLGLEPGRIEQAVEIAVQHTLDHRPVDSALLRQRDEQPAGARSPPPSAARNGWRTRTHRRAPGSSTPSTGAGANSCASASSAMADTVLHATTRHLTPLSCSPPRPAASIGGSSPGSVCHRAAVPSHPGTRSLGRQRPGERREHREPTHAGVEHADGDLGSAALGHNGKFGPAGRVFDISQSLAHCATGFHPAARRA